MVTPSQRTSLIITLSLAALAPAASAQTTRLTPSGAPTGGAVRVQPSAAPEPAATSVTAGGPVEHPGCGGFVTARPQVVITAAADLPWLRVYAEGSGDTSLAILGPNNQWRCADDTYGANPSIDGRFRRGAYRVWVATPTANATAPATVTVTAQRAQRPTDAPIAVAPGSSGNPQDPMAAATGLAQQVLTGLGGGNSTPLAVPLSTLSRAGLTPTALPPSLDSVLRQPGTNAGSLTPAQLTQLAELARSGMSADQLAPVMGALTNGQNPQGTLSPTQLSQLGQLARGGATPQAVQTALSSMLRGVGTSR